MSIATRKQIGSVDSGGSERPTRRTVLPAVLLLFVFLMAPYDAAATLSFGAARRIAPEIPQDGLAIARCAGTDGNGTVIVAWTPTVHPDVTDTIVLSRSTDDGDTWSAPQTLVIPGLASDTGWCGIVADSAGNWLVGPRYNHTGASYSSDGGQSWTHRTDVSVSSVVIDGQGVWIRVFDGEVTRSLDGGATWSSPVAAPFGGNPEMHAFGAAGVIAVGIAASYDSGATWVMVGPPPVQDIHSFVTSTPSGTLILGVEDFYSPYGTSVTRSFDGGATWDTPSLSSLSNHWLNHLRALDESRIVSFADRTEHLGDDFDLYVSRSLDLGSTWTESAYAVGSRGGDDRLQAVLRTSPNKWLMVWCSDPGPYGYHSVFVSSAWDLCPPVPAASCATADSGRARASIKDGPGEGDSLVWQWSRAGAPSGDLGDPLSTSTYALCVYDTAAGSHRLQFQKDARVGETSASGAPLWKAVGDGFAYADKSKRSGALKGLRVRAGASATKLKVNVSGATFGAPNLPLGLDPEVRFQLLNVETGSCWESAFNSASTNDGSRFRAP